MGSHKETFEMRKRYNGQATEFLDRLLMIVPIFVITAFTLYPLGYIHSNHYTLWGYVLFNVGLIGVSLIKTAQRFIPLRSTFTLELIATAAVSLGGCMMITYVVGFQHFFVIFWLIPAIYAYLQFSMKGFAFLVFLLWAMAAVDVFRFEAHPTDSDYYIYTLMYLVTLNIIAFVIIKILDFSQQSQRVIEQTRRREVRHRTRLQAVLDNMSEALITVSKNGEVDLQNKTAPTVYGGSLVGSHLDDLFHLTDAKGRPVKAADLLSNHHKAIFRDDLRHNVGHGDTVRFSMLITPLDAETVKQNMIDSGFVIIFRDITKLKTLDEERDEFVSVLSHELRTPISIAGASIDTWMLLHDKEGQQPVVEQAASSARNQVTQLADIIDHLGILTRTERGEGSQTEEINLKELFKELFDEFKPQVAKDVELKLELPDHLPPVRTSKTYLIEIMRNLLSNAVKYTEKGSIKLYVENGEHGLECGVADTGIGISFSDQKRIFNKFYRAEDYRTEETGGIGLGLYVVRRISEKMNAKIKLVSQLNEGSTFALQLSPQSDK